MSCQEARPGTASSSPPSSWNPSDILCCVPPGSDLSPAPAVDQTGLATAEFIGGILRQRQLGNPENVLPRRVLLREELLQATLCSSEHCLPRNGSQNC